jgi:DNA invertase Pin-like site-specific DNA recombinase
MSIYAYCRPTADLTVEAQQRRVAEQAIKNGWTIDETVIEDDPRRSMPLRKRRQGKRLLKRLQTHDTIIAAGLTSFFASPFEAAAIMRDFQQRQISLWLLEFGDEINRDQLGGTPLNVLSAIIELGSIRSGTIREGKAKLRAEGKYQGGKRPVGWQVGADRILTPDAVEQAAIARMRELHAEGKSYREIARDAGIAISYVTVRRIVKRLG